VYELEGSYTLLTQYLANTIEIIDIGHKYRVIHTRICNKEE